MTCEFLIEGRVLFHGILMQRQRFDNINVEDIEKEV